MLSNIILFAVCAYNVVWAGTYNQDGLGYSGMITTYTSLRDPIQMTGYNSWPSGFKKGLYAFAGGVYDGTSIWMIPNAADRVIRLNGTMTGYNSWPSGFKKGIGAFNGGVYDGTSIWMIPSSADRVIRINAMNGTMTGYNSWPSGFTKDGVAFYGGLYDGTSIWMMACDADRVIRINAMNGTMTGYDSWPSGFTKEIDAFRGGVYEGTSLWMIPHNADRVIRIDALNGTMAGYNTWPSGFKKGGGAFIGGVYDGTSIWMIPHRADRVIRIDALNGTMTGCDSWPSGFTKEIDAFIGGAYDGTSIWMMPYFANRVIRIDALNGTMTGYSSWPSGFTKSIAAFSGGVYDGTSIWMIPFNADRVIRIFSPLFSTKSLTRDITTSVSVTHTTLSTFSFTRRTQRLQNIVTIIATSSSIVSTGGSLLIVSPEVVLSSQMLQLAAQCRQAQSLAASSSSGASKDPTLRPIISLGRTVSLPSSLSLRIGGENFIEFVMLIMTVSTFYAAHFIFVLTKSSPGGRGCMPTGKNEWVHAVTVLRYPNLTVRYQLSIVLPLVGNAVSAMTTSGVNVLNKIIGSLVLCMCFIVLGLLCYLSNNHSHYVSYSDDDGSTNHHMTIVYFLESGKWTPKISLANGGAFFSQYTSFLKPYVWIWTTMIVGIVMTVVATDELTPPHVCSSFAGLGSMYFLISGLIHVLLRNRLMIVKGLCLLRGIRMVFCGGAMGFIVMDTFVEHDDIMTFLTTMCTYGAIVFTMLETICGWMIFTKKSTKRWQKHIGMQ